MSSVVSLSDFQRVHVCPVLCRFQTSNVFMYIQFCIASDFQRFHVYPVLYRVQISNVFMYIQFGISFTFLRTVLNCIHTHINFFCRITLRLTHVWTLFLFITYQELPAVVHMCYLHTSMPPSS